MRLSEILTAVAGGALIGVSAIALLLLDGRLAGISNIVGGLAVPRRGEIGWRAAFVLGLLAGGVLLRVAHPEAFAASLPRSPLVLGIGGLLVGLGAGPGNGCTSGHGVCGLGRRSPRSLVATITFMSTGMLTVWIVVHVLGGLARP